MRSESVGWEVGCGPAEMVLSGECVTSVGGGRPALYGKSPRRSVRPNRSQSTFTSCRRTTGRSGRPVAPLVASSDGVVGSKGRSNPRSWRRGPRTFCSRCFWFPGGSGGGGPEVPGRSPPSPEGGVSVTVPLRLAGLCGHAGRVRRCCYRARILLRTHVRVMHFDRERRRRGRDPDGVRVRLPSQGPSPESQALPGLLP